MFRNIKKSHCYAGCLAIVLSAFVLLCSVANTAYAIGVVPSAIAEYLKHHTPSGWMMSKFFLAGSDEVLGCRVVPYNDSKATDTLLAASFSNNAGNKHFGLVKIDVKDRNILTLPEDSSITKDTGAVNQVVGPYGGPTAIINADAAGLDTNPGDCTVATPKAHACHNHGDGAYECDYDKGLNCDEIFKEMEERCGAHNTYLVNRDTYRDEQERFASEEKAYGECLSRHAKDKDYSDCSQPVPVTMKEPEDDPNYKEEDCTSEKYTCATSPIPICVSRGYPREYWFAEVNVKVDKPVARPGDVVNYTYSIDLVAEDKESSTRTCTGDGISRTYVANHATTDYSGVITVDTNTVGEKHQFTLPPHTRHMEWTVPHVVNQSDVGTNIFGEINASPANWRCVDPYLSRSGVKPGLPCVVKSKANSTVHYNWDVQLKSERKVESPHWNEPKPYGIETVNAYPLDFVTFKHTANLKYEYGMPAGRMLYYTLTNKPIDFYDHNDVFLLDEHRVERSQRWVKQWPTGVLPGVAQPPIVEGYVKNFFQHMPVTQDNVNTTMCEHITARPGSFIGSMIHNDPLGGRIGDLEHRSNDACVHFPYHYVHENPPYGKVKPDCTFNGTCPDNKVPDDYNGGLKVSVSKNVDHVLLGDGFEFSDVTTHNGGRTKSKPYQYESYIAIFRGDAVNANNQKGSLIYPGRDFRNGNINCMPGLNGNPHKVDRGAIKYCHSLCIHVDNDAAKPCVDARPSIPVGESVTTTYRDHKYDKEMFDEAKEPQPGDKICYWVAIADWSAIDDVSANSTLVSNMECIDIAKQPQMKIIGGDTIANGNIAGAYYNPVNPINDDRGSWSQYGLFSNGKIRDFGTAGFSVAWEGNQFKGCTLAYSNRLGLSPGKCEVSDKSQLGKFGMYSDGDKGYAPKVPVVDPTKLNKYTDSEIDFGASGFKSGNKEVALSYEGAKDLNIHGKLPDGARVVVYVANGAQVNVTGDVMPEHNEFKSLSDVPSLTVISSNDININDNVENIFGNYISSKGHIYTCADAKSDADKGESSKLGVTDKCNKHMLRVQGALVSADNIVFHRTYGSRNFDLATRSLPSEEIDYTPNTFLLPYYSSYKFGDNTTFVIRTANNILPRY